MIFVLHSINLKVNIISVSKEFRNISVAKKTKIFSAAEIETFCILTPLLEIKRFVGNKEKSVKLIRIIQNDLKHSMEEEKITTPL